MRNRGRQSVILTLVLSLMLTACNLPGLAGQQVDVDAQAAATVQAELTRLAAEVVVDNAAPSATEPAPATEEPTAAPATATPEGPTPTAGVEGCSDRAAFVSDVTIEDGHDLDKGENFTKTWRLRNAGTCTWSSSYSLVFDHGDQMSAPAAVALTGTVAPGATVDLSVNMTAPNSPGVYQGFWKLRNNGGVLYGIGAGGNTAFWVKIEVLPPSPTPTATGLIVVPLFPLPFFIYNSSGQNQVLADGSCFELDDGSAAGCGAASADLRYDYSIQLQIFPNPPLIQQRFVPLHGSKVRYAGNSKPSKADCQGMVLGNTAIDMDTGKYYCYQTGDGLYGWLHPTSLSQASMTFDWGTYQ
ncbi:MAG: NBR1-Ig-like domain-containing protein [Anaerolineales bacterium]